MSSAEWEITRSPTDDYAAYNHALKEGAAGINVIIALSYLFSHLLLYDMALQAHFDNLQ